MYIETKDTLYTSGVPAILNVMQHPDYSLKEVMLFGHNPDLTSLANYLANHDIDNISTCDVFCVDFDVKTWQEVAEGIGFYKFFDYPKKQ